MSGSRLVPTEFSKFNSMEDFVMFLNVVGGVLNEEENGMKFEADRCFQGGQSSKTDESIENGGDYASVYQSTRSGNFSYKFENLPPGDYFVDLHFVEIIYTYGQTGTGKTFTMEGPEHNRGFNYRTLEELFNRAKERSETFTYSISVGMLEVYNEQIRDLLATSPATKKLEIRQASEGVHHVPGIVEAKVENIKEVWDVLLAGSNARVVG